MNRVKVYVEVFARFTSDGKLLPVALIWEDGSKYLIDRIVKYERCASRRAGGAGIMYTCMIAGQECHLFYEENQKWFLERKST